MQGSEDADPLSPNRALTSLLPAEGAEFGFYFPEVALQGDTPITPMNVESCWKGGCWARPAVCWGGGGDGKPWAFRKERGC